MSRDEVVTSREVVGQAVTLLHGLANLLVDCGRQGSEHRVCGGIQILQRSDDVHVIWAWINNSIADLV